MSDQPEGTTPDRGLLYRGARERITALLRDHGADQTEVPATPAWRVHDVIVHLRGVVEDALGGNVDGAGTDPWTAVQVECGRSKPLAQLLEEWAEQAPSFEAFLSFPAGSAAGAAVFDVVTHESDLRAALGLPTAPPDEFAAWAMAGMAENLVSRVADAQIPSLRITTPAGDAFGPEDASVTLDVDRYEFIRAYLGRRCPDQVRTWNWSGDPSPYLPHLAVFGPRETPLID